MKKIKVLLLVLLCLFSYKSVYAVTLSNHSTMSHSKEQIIEKYNASKSTFNYNNSVYKENPSTSVPYFEGSLKEGVENDVLNHLNFYRWLAGLNSVTINTSRQSANQKGALIMAVNGVLSHYPNKPAGMDDAFYNEGYAACGSRANTWQGNISNGYRIDNTPETFITDNTNVQPNVAHRSSLLNPKAKQVSFGYVNRFSTMSIHYDNTNPNSDAYNPWPSAGYFPIEAMDQDANTRWSIYLGNYSMTTSTQVTLTYNGNSYTVNRSNLYFTEYSRNMYYNLPTELRNQITENNLFKQGVIVNVKIDNLTNSNTNYSIVYDVKFFSVTEKKVEKITLDKTNISLEVEDEEDLIATITPSDASDKNIDWISSDNSIATVTNGRVRGIKAGTVTITAIASSGKTATCQVTVTKATPGVAYTTHVQDIGWQKYVSNGKMSGTSHESKRLEAIKIKLKGITYSGNIEYKTHIEDIGWERYFKKNDEMSGTSHQSKRLEGIKIRLTGEVAEHYDVYYRVHAQEFGWLGWAKNGELSGTSGYSYRLEAIEIKLIEKGKTLSEYGQDIAFHSKNGNVYIEPTKISYTTHVEDIGWQDYVYDGEMAGTSHQSKRLESIKIRLEDQEYSGNIEYRTHIEDIGWETNFKKNDEISGTEHQSKRLEAIEIKLTGEIANHFDVYYRVHAQEFGWLGWARNGEKAGSAHYSYRLEAIEIKLVEKGTIVPEYGTLVAFKDKNDTITETPKVLYKTHVQDIGWQDYVKDGEMSGTSHQSKRLEGIQIKLDSKSLTGNIEYRTHIQDIGWETNYKKNDEMSGTEHQSKRLEAIEIKLTGEIANHYDVYYRVHAQEFGWLNWAKNGEKAGTAHYSYRLEGIEILLIPKGEKPPVRTDQNQEAAFYER